MVILSHCSWMYSFSWRGEKCGSSTRLYKLEARGIQRDQNYIEIHESDCVPHDLQPGPDSAPPSRAPKVGQPSAQWPSTSVTTSCFAICLPTCWIYLFTSHLSSGLMGFSPASWDLLRNVTLPACTDCGLPGVTFTYTHPWKCIIALCPPDHSLSQVSFWWLYLQSKQVWPEI